MKRLLMKEASDLAPAAVVIGLAGAGVEAAVARHSHHPLPSLALLCGGLGCAMGIAQGFLDRRRRDDPFLLHRPMSAARLHAVRGIAGAALAAIAATVAVVVQPLVPFDSTIPEGQTAATWSWRLERNELEPMQMLTCVVAAVLFHAVARLAMSPRRWIASALLVIVLPVMTLYALLSLGTQSAPWLAFAAVLAIATSLDALNLARRPA